MIDGGKVNSKISYTLMTSYQIFLALIYTIQQLNWGCISLCKSRLVTLFLKISRPIKYFNVNRLFRYVFVRALVASEQLTRYRLFSPSSSQTCAQNAKISNAWRNSSIHCVRWKLYFLRMDSKEVPSKTSGHCRKFFLKISQTYIE